MDSEGMAPEFLREFNWDAFDLASASREELEWLAEPIGKFFMAHNKTELYEGALKRGIMFYPVSTAEDIMEDPQLKAREFFTQVKHPELDTHISYPEAFVKLSDAPIRIYRRAPLIGEHNEEVYAGELGFSREELVLLKQGDII
jgi:formyl-CoA transferase